MENEVKKVICCHSGASKCPGRLIGPQLAMHVPAFFVYAQIIIISSQRYQPVTQYFCSQTAVILNS